MQAYDSVAIEADVEIGGTDQLYNLLTGRDVMERYGLEPQLVVTYPLLVGLDGVEKMSKSRGNYIGINEPPEEMFGKTMSIPDEALPQWWELLAGGGEHPDEPDGMEARARAPHHRALARARRAPRAGEAHFTRVVRQARGARGGARGDLRRPTAARCYLPAVLQARLRAVVEPLAPPDRPGRGEGGRRGARRATSRAGAALDGALVQAGKRHFVRLRLRLTAGRRVLLCPGCPRGRCRKVPANDHNGVALDTTRNERLFRQF